MASYALKKNIDILKKVDIIVAGGGPAGFAAAITASRNGADVLLIEKFNCLGGTGTAGLVGPFMPTDGTNGGIYKELIDRLQEQGAIKTSWYYRIFNCFDDEQYKYIAQLMCEEAGVKFLLNSYIVDVICEDSMVKGVVIANKGGLQAVEAQVVIDATGDGDVAYLAGAKYEKGDEDGDCQPTSYIFNIGGLKKIKLTDNDIEVLKEGFAEARRQGKITLPEHVNNIWYWADFIGEGSTVRDGEITINIDMTSGIDATDPQELTQAELDGRRHVWECMRFFKEYIPGAEDAYVLKTASLHGIRETRRIFGKYYLTEIDVKSGRKFEDGICKASFNVDIHGPSKQAKKRPLSEKRRERQEWEKTRCVPEGDWYEIPYRCLVPERITNLLVAGRCISSDRKANGSLRIMPTCMATGQAAGMAAALAVERGAAPSRINGMEIRNMLIEEGADLQKV